MALADFDSPGEWARDLDRRWPERAVLKDTLLAEIEGHLTYLDHPPRLLELGIGAGELLLRLRKSYTNAFLAGLDVQVELTEFVSNGLAGDVLLVAADLRDTWPPLGGGFDVVFTLQTLHDVGGAAAQQRVYGQAAAALVPGGLFLNADFVVPMAHDDPRVPQRLPASKHLAMLRAERLGETAVVTEAGGFACVRAVRPKED